MISKRVFMKFLNSMKHN